MLQFWVVVLPSLITLLGDILPPDPMAWLTRLPVSVVIWSFFPLYIGALIVVSRAALFDHRRAREPGLLIFFQLVMPLVPISLQQGTVLLMLMWSCSTQLLLENMAPALGLNSAEKESHDLLLFFIWEWALTVISIHHPFCITLVSNRPPLSVQPPLPCCG